jgi:hypothetical protein
MNYAVVAIGAVILLVILAWFGWGRKSFKGPVATAALEEHKLDKKDATMIGA